MTSLTSGRFLVALIAAALAGAAAPDVTVLVAAHVGLLAGGVAIVRALSPSHGEDR